MIEFSQIWLPLLLTFLAGMSTGIGSLISLFINKFKQSYLTFALGLSAGVMIYVSFVELLPNAIKNIGMVYANISFFIGVLLIMLIDFLIPHNYIEEHAKIKDPKLKKLLKAGVLSAIGIAIHNFPEGLVVFLSSLTDARLSIPLAFAIALHNIPEGIAISMPIYYATKNKSKAFWFSFIAGIAEPIGAILGIIILAPFLSESVMSIALAFVAGIMIFISFDELLPLCFSEGKNNIGIAGIIIGMIVMAVSLIFL